MSTKHPYRGVFEEGGVCELCGADMWHENHEAKPFGSESWKLKCDKLFKFSMPKVDSAKEDEYGKELKHKWKVQAWDARNDHSYNVVESDELIDIYNAIMREVTNPHVRRLELEKLK